MNYVSKLVSALGLIMLVGCNEPIAIPDPSGTSTPAPVTLVPGQSVSSSSLVDPFTLYTVDSSTLGTSGKDGDWDIDPTGNNTIWKKSSGTWAPTPVSIKGNTGATGPQGLPGAPGSQGLTGATGATGPAGPQGIPGANGTNGVNGSVGATGPQGIPGINGTNGVDGAAGVSSLNTRTGSITLNSTDIINALGFTPLKTTTDTLNGDLNVTGIATVGSLSLASHLVTNAATCGSDITGSSNINFNTGNTICSTVSGGPPGSCTEIRLFHAMGENTLILTGMATGGCYHFTTMAPTLPVYTSGNLDSVVGKDTVIQVIYATDRILLIGNTATYQP
jgi:hypothetical protein